MIVGRAAGYILREREDCLRVFIHADTDKRIKRAMEKEGLKDRRNLKFLCRFCQNIAVIKFIPQGTCQFLSDFVASAYH